MKYITDEQSERIIDSIPVFSIFAREKKVKGKKVIERAIDPDVIKDIQKENAKGSLQATVNKANVRFPSEYHEKYKNYRERDMYEDETPVETEGTPTLKELNFNHKVVGSDETGNGELFKPFIVTAACVENIEQLRRCIDIGITDSKNYDDKPEYIDIIGKEITGFDKWEDILQELNSKEMCLPKERKGKNPDDYKMFIDGDFFVTRIITNEEINWRYECDSVNVLDELKREGHKDVLERLRKRHPGSIIVIDNFLHATKVNEYREYLKSGYTEKNVEVYLTERADAKVMAVGLAAMISSYFCALGMRFTKEKIAETCELSVDMLPELPRGSNDTDRIVKILKTIKERCEKIYENKNTYEELLDTYVKRYYDFKDPKIRELLGLPAKK